MIFIQFFNHQSFLEGHSLIASSHLVLFLLSFPYLGIILGIKKSTQTKNFSPRALNYRLFIFFYCFATFFFSLPAIFLLVLIHKFFIFFLKSPTFPLKCHKQFLSPDFKIPHSVVYCVYTGIRS